MNIEWIDNYINRKMSENENKIIFTFYELRVKSNLTEEETDKFLELSKIKLENNNYDVYFTGARYTYANESKIVEDNELMVATKEED